MSPRAAFKQHIRFGEFELDPATSELARNGRKFSLQEQPFQILCALLERQGQLVSREELRKRLWSSSTFVDFEHGLNKAMNRLREVLEDSAENPKFIETLPRRGYRFIAAVEFVDSPSPDAEAREGQAVHSASPSGNLTGKKVSHYRVLEILGGGGMGVVYKAEDLKLGRRVALKFLPEELSTDAKALERFEREARAASALNHPNICTIHEVEEHEGQPFIVMELLEGQTLRELISAADTSEGRYLQLKTLLDIASQMADGLDAAHKKGVIHRDIKPANIFITKNGQVKILDFGLAKLQEVQLPELPPRAVGEQNPSQAWNPTLTLTRTGAAIGTAGYMSPEQVRGEKLDTRTDLFNFGLVLYEMAASQRAFTGETAPMLREAILNCTPAAVRELNSEVPAALEAIINRALKKDRERRYQAASEMRVELARLPHDTAPKRSPTRWTRAVAGAFALFAFVATLYWLIARQPTPQVGLPELKQRQLTANPSDNAVVGGAISPDGRYLAFSDLNGLHIKLIETGDTVDVPQPESLKGLQVNWGIVSTWIRDGTRFVADAGVRGRPTSIWIVPVTGEPRKVRDDAFAGSVTRDGSWIAFTVHNHEMWVMQPDGGQARKVFQAAEGDDLFGADWSPDGQRISYNNFHPLPNGGEFTLQSRDLHGGPPLTALVTHADPVADWSWLPDGRILYSMADPGPAGETCNFWTVRIEPKTGKPIEKPKRLTDWAGFGADSPSPTADGKKLVFRRLSWQDHVDVGDLGNGDRIYNVRRLTNAEGRNYPASWTTDSKAVVFGAYRDGKWKIFKQQLDTARAEPIVTTAMDMFGAQSRVSADGVWVLFLAPPLDQAAGRVGVRLMRAPIRGGPSELVLTARIPGYGAYHDPMCARSPATLCVITEEAEDQKHLIFTAFDPLRGRGRELFQFDTGSDNGAYDWDLSPDGTRIAVIRMTGNRIHIMSFDGQPPQDVVVKSGAELESVSWTSDGKGFYASTAVRQGWALLRIDLQGNSHIVWRQKGSAAAWGANTDLGMGDLSAPWAVPSPDGRRVAIYTWTLSANMWMMENF